MADRFDKFTERARHVLTLAQEEALRFNHNYIGTEHLLLGLVREEEGVAVTALRNLGVELDRIRSAVEVIIGRGDRAVMGEVGLTPRAKKVIELAVDEARQLGHQYIGTEHILLGLVREGEGIAAGVLESLGLSLDKVRAEVVRILSEVTGKSAAQFATESKVTHREDPFPEVATADRFDKFTERARQALLAAQSEAVARSQNYVGTEHLLLGLLRQPDSTASKAIAGLGIHLEQIRQAASVRPEAGPQPGSAQIGLSPRARRVIELAVDEARQLKAANIGTEHVLLGLVLEEGGIGGQILRTLGITMDSARAEVKRLVVAGAHEKAGAATIDGRAIAAQVREEARERALALHARGVTPGLALVLVGENPSSMSYVRSKGDAAEQAGLYSDMFHFPETVDEETVTSRILELNRDRRFHGILVQLPLPKQMREGVVMNSIDPVKDADGVTAASMGHLLRGEPCPWPATPAGVIELLHRTGNAPAGKHVVICGRSNIVGKPLAGILMQKNERANATVTMCHTGTPNLAYHTRQADILISAIGMPGAITADMVKPGAVVIDVGNNWIEDASRKSGRRLVGDVDYEGVREVASAITPVPGGVGPMTVAMLISNTVWLAERYG